MRSNVWLFLSLYILTSFSSTFLLSSNLPSSCVSSLPSPPPPPYPLSSSPSFPPSRQTIPFTSPPLTRRRRQVPSRRPNPAESAGEIPKKIRLEMRRLNDLVACIAVSGRLHAGSSWPGCESSASSNLRANFWGVQEKGNGPKWRTSRRPRRVSSQFRWSNSLMIKAFIYTTSIAIALMHCNRELACIDVHIPPPMF